VRERARSLPPEHGAACAPSARRVAVNNASEAAHELRQLLLDVGAPTAIDPLAPWLIVAAHPDDETIGASWILRRCPRVHVLHVTDGAPEDAALRTGPASATRLQYAALRRQEAHSALALAGLPLERTHTLGFVDQRASQHLPALTRQLAHWIALHQPAVIVVHPYEGGHPDHDAAAFAAHQAVARTPRAQAPLLLEMTSYHRTGGTLRTGEFLPASPGQPREVERVFSPAERAHKAQMMACFASQADVLASFTIDHERFRIAPQYDFCAPPAPSPLHYETLGWATTGAHWRELSARALTRYEEDNA
jgi:LmbE family N-acetylglucosaminyl deacetylase